METSDQFSSFSGSNEIKIIIMNGVRLQRRLSEPPLSGRSQSMCTIVSSSLSRERKRSTVVRFEQGKDQALVWFNEWSTKEICSVLSCLIQRCSLNQMKFLWTALESVPHKDFLHQAMRKFPSVAFQPLSTPISRELKARLQRSRYPENKTLFRTQSLLISYSLSKSSHSHQPTPIPETTPLFSLPGLRSSTAPGSIPNQSCTYHNSIRTCSPARRHMSLTLSNPGTPSCFILPTVRTDAWTNPTGYCQLKKSVHSVSSTGFLPLNGLQFLVWFSNLEKDWQKQEVLQLITWSLDQNELYHLAVLLLSRQYRDFVADLPLSLSLKILSHVPGKDILLACQVSKQWYGRCIDETLWRTKCGQIHLGLPPVIKTTWRQLYIDNIKLRRRWRLGQAQTLPLTNHTHRILCIRIKENEEICASGSGDRTINLWRLTDGKLINTLRGHTKKVWSLCFYGLNLLISGSSDTTIRVWNIRTGKCERSLEGHNGTVWSLQQKGDILVSGSHDNTAILWNIRQCKYKRHLIGHSGAVFGVDLDDTTRLAFTASGDKTIRVWNTRDGQCVNVIQASSKYSIISLHYSKSMLVYSAGSAVCLWSLSCDKLQRQFRGHQDRVECVHLETEGSNCNTIISCGRDGLVKYWNTESGNCIRTLGPLPASINSIHRDSLRIVTGSDDSTVTIWDFNPLSNLHSISRPPTALKKFGNSRLPTAIQARNIPRPSTALPTTRTHLSVGFNDSPRPATAVPFAPSLTKLTNLTI